MFGLLKWKTCCTQNKTIHRQDNAMPHTIALQLDNPAITLEKAGGSAGYTVHIAQPGISLDLALDAVSFETLVRQGKALIPSPNATLTTPELETIRRQSAWPLKRLDDRSWQTLLRESSCSSLVTLLWYLKDVELAKTVMRNLSQRAAIMLTEDLVTQFRGRDPDRVSAAEAERGHQPLEEVLAILYRLVDEGKIPEFNV
jgi:hypothetical protein